MVGLILAGMLSGIISGMGIGGGTILIPALTIIFNMPQKTAQSINLIYFVPTAVIALKTHIKNKRVDTKVAKGIVIFGLIGAIIGSFVALGLDNNILKRLFGIFLLLMGIREIYISKGCKNEKQ